MREYLCDCEECLCLNFFSCVKNTSKLMENKNNDTSDSESCLRDEENGPTNAFEFATIPWFVAVMSCIISEPICFIKIVQKNVTKENLRDDCGHETFPGGCYLKENLFAEG